MDQENKKLNLDFVPEGADQITIELWVRKEELQAKSRACELRISRLTPDIELMERIIKRDQAVLRNLRGKHTSIISLREFTKITNDIRKISKILQDNKDFVTIETQTILAIKREVFEIETLIEKRLNPQNLLIFRPRQ